MFKFKNENLPGRGRLHLVVPVLRVGRPLPLDGAALDVPVVSALGVLVPLPPGGQGVLGLVGGGHLF